MARTVELPGDKWSLLIAATRSPGYGASGSSSAASAWPRTSSGTRLRTLTDAGVLRSEPASDGGSYREYVLTDKGRELFDLILGLR